MTGGWEMCQGITPLSASILELGTKRSQPDRPTHHKADFPDARMYVMADIESGEDVDVVADAHNLGAHFAYDTFDLIQAHSVFEHLQRPWIAMQSIASILKPDGLVYICTHQTFPIHGYPNDYWRFTTEALETICEDAHMTVLTSGYQYPCTITPPSEIGGPLAPWNPQAPAFLNVQVLARRT